ncbi:uncharacterized protein EV420DRAFT_1735687 [Desarmillaria tabescens]|uniref:Uncharacterized protein n=1 Tax=Armillaria tabescens TaxID=1929756 RepID=A0AA39JEF6_ARMTA|nr:uncharacterized protein EV420DRAFT_1735687 [Desarmillaria tabescens]KAK0439093.1 hypothetical protein EV420DRAFT_1735687 [Desarmillaria tabescens]
MITFSNGSMSLDDGYDPSKGQIELIICAGAQYFSLFCVDGANPKLQDQVLRSTKELAKILDHQNSFVDPEIASNRHLVKRVSNQRIEQIQVALTWAFKKAKCLAGLILTETYHREDSPAPTSVTSPQQTPSREETENSSPIESYSPKASSPIESFSPMAVVHSPISEFDSGGVVPPPFDVFTTSLQDFDGLYSNPERDVPSHHLWYLHSEPHSPALDIIGSTVSQNLEHASPLLSPIHIPELSSFGDLRQTQPSSLLFRTIGKYRSPVNGSSHPDSLSPFPGATQSVSHLSALCHRDVSSTSEAVYGSPDNNDGYLLPNSPLFTPEGYSRSSTIHNDGYLLRNSPLFTPESSFSSSQDGNGSYHLLNSPLFTP